MVFSFALKLFEKHNSVLLVLGEMINTEVTSWSNMNKIQTIPTLRESYLLKLRKPENITPCIFHIRKKTVNIQKG